jgi:UDP-2,3-diacylglucosamine pyrophosphatase LpxH
MKKEVAVFSDVELGAGNLTDDFISDVALSKTIVDLSRKKHDVDLVFNGDTMDFLKCPYMDQGHLTYPWHVTEEISLGKLDLVYQAHTKVFETMKSFAKCKGKNIYFVIGNHDFDLVWPKMQKKLKEIIGYAKKVHFVFEYENGGLYVEHGNQRDLFNGFDKNNLYLSFKGEKILNFPWSSFMVIHSFISLKEVYPFTNRFVPWSTVLSFSPDISKLIVMRVTRFIFRALFYTPIKKFIDPTLSFPRKIISAFIARARSFKVEPDIVAIFRAREDLVDGKKLVILGHAHHELLSIEEDKTIIQMGAWRDEYLLNRKTKSLTHQKKKYVSVMVHGEELDYTLVHVPIKRRSLKFNEVLGNEMKFLRRAAKEEGFVPRLVK